MVLLPPINLVRNKTQIALALTSKLKGAGLCTAVRKLWELITAEWKSVNCQTCCHFEAAGRPTYIRHGAFMSVLQRTTASVLRYQVGWDPADENTVFT